MYRKLEELESKIQGYSTLVKPAEEILEAEEERIGCLSVLSENEIGRLSQNRRIGLTFRFFFK